MLTVPKTISRSYFEKNQELYPKHAIACYPWAAEGSYRPESFVRVAHNGSAIFVRLWCREKEPRTAVTEWNGDVWTDSALEFFIEPVRGEGYFNFEMNSHPTMLAYFGVDTADDRRVPVEWPHEALTLASRFWNRGGADWWEVAVTIPFDALRKYVPSFRPVPGTVIRANAFKCGDSCAEPHYGCLFPIDAKKNPEPAFHLPQYFGEWKLL